MLTPLQWLAADVARCYGLDKVTWDERLAWTAANPGLMPGAKEPFLYASAHAAYTDALAGKPIDHLISLDATASGIQCLALMSQDAESALSVNLGTQQVMNPYQRVNDHMGDYPYERVKKAVVMAA